jgi:hypothetical protein
MGAAELWRRDALLQRGTPGSRARETCRQLADLLVRKSDTLIDLRAGIALGERAGWSPERLKTLREAVDGMKSPSAADLQDLSCGSVDQLRAVRRGREGGRGGGAEGGRGGEEAGPRRGMTRMNLQTEERHLAGSTERRPTGRRARRDRHPGQRIRDPRKRGRALPADQRQAAVGLRHRIPRGVRAEPPPVGAHRHPACEMVRVFQAYLAGEPWKPQLDWAAGFGPDGTSGAALWTFARPVLLALVVGLVVVALVIQS